MLTIEPLPRATMRGTASEAQRKNPFRCVAITADQSANETWPTRPTRWMPALLTRISRRPAPEMDDSVPRPARSELVEREDTSPVDEQSLGDGVADPTRRAGYDRDAP